jgi:hypothetical protein
MAGGWSDLVASAGAVVRCAFTHPQCAWSKAREGEASGSLASEAGWGRGEYLRSFPLIPWSNLAASYMMMKYGSLEWQYAVDWLLAGRDV